MPVHVYVIVHDQPSTPAVADNLRAYKDKHVNMRPINGCAFAIGCDDVPEQVNFSLNAVFDGEHYMVVPISKQPRGNLPAGFASFVDGLLP